MLRNGGRFTPEWVAAIGPESVAGLVRKTHPYKSVIEFYLKELHYLEDSKKRPMKIIDPGKTAIAARDFIEVF